MKASLAFSAQNGLPRYETLQPLYNLIDREPYEAELEPLVLETFEHTLEAVGAPRADGAELASEYRAAVARLGVA